MKPLAVVGVLLCFVGLADAQCYSVGGCYRQTYTPYYTVPYVPPQTYVTPHVDYYTQTAVVGKAYPVYLPLLSYTSLDDNVRSYYSTKRATKEGYLEALREAAAEGIFSGVGGGGQQPVPPVGPVPNPPPGIESRSPPPAATPNPNVPPPKAKAGALTINKILQTKCASCHNPQQPERVPLHGDPSKIPGYIRDKCVVLTADRSMPMKGDKLTQEEFDVVQAWAKSAPLEPPSPTPIPKGTPSPPVVPPAGSPPAVPPAPPKGSGQ